MKRRICVNFSGADRWKGKRVKWIVCKKCKRKVARGLK